MQLTRGRGVALFMFIAVTQGTFGVAWVTTGPWVKLVRGERE
jgi:hypothetical protein